MSLINWEINIILALSANCVIAISTGAGTFSIRGTKLCVLVVTLSTNDNAKLLHYYKLLQKLKSDFKATVNWNKYQSKVMIETQN